MRVLLIGGTGFIGRPLTNELVANGHSIAILHRHLRGNQLNSGETILGDRNDLASSGDQIQKFRPDVIIDLILSSGEQARELMNLAQTLVPRVIALSSMDVYRAWAVFQGIEEGPLEPLPLTEQSALRQIRRLYSPDAVRRMQAIFPWLTESYDKIAVEESILGNEEVAGTILRLPMVFGPQDRLQRFLPICKRIADGRRSMILSEDIASWRGPRGYVENVAHAIALALRPEAQGRIYNVCQEPCLSELEWHTKIAEVAKWDGKLVVLPKKHTPPHLLSPGNFSQHVIASSARI